jgi:hypothetical protein
MLFAEILSFPMSQAKNLTASRAGTSFTKATALLCCGQMRPAAVCHWNKQQQQQSGPGFTA